MQTDMKTSDVEREEARDDVTFSYAGGISSFVEYLNENKTILFDRPIYFKGTRAGDDGQIEAEVALLWNDAYSENIFSFVNNISTRQGGTHVSRVAAGYACRSWPLS